MISLNQQLKSVIDNLGMDVIIDVKSVSGGDINQSYRLIGKEQYFLKINEASRYPKMFEKEAHGLNALRGATNCLVPEVVHYGEVDNTQYLILKWIEEGSAKKNFWEDFGKALVGIHQRTKPYFGFEENNYIGSLHQHNEYKTTWGEFYCENRILPLVKQLYDSHSINQSVINSAEALCSKLNDIFPKEKPSLLHGDLWSGNFMIASDGNPSIFDPAVYYGHREMDLGMTNLFGGFDQRFYHAYNEAFSLEKNWKKRLELTQLYPLLVHAILFGGGYIQQVVSIINRFG